MTWDETEHKWKAFNADQPRDERGRLEPSSANQMAQMIVDTVQHNQAKKEWSDVEAKWKGSPDQPRDAQGRWAGGGAGLPGSVGGTNKFHPHAGLNKAVADHEALLMQQADERNHMPTDPANLSASMTMHARHASELQASFEKIRAAHQEAQKNPVGVKRVAATANLADTINKSGAAASKTTGFHSVASAIDSKFGHTFPTHFGATAEDVTNKINAVLPTTHEAYNVKVTPRANMRPLAVVHIREKH